MEERKKIVHDFSFIGRILTILKILQEETDEYTTISQTEIKNLMEEYEHPCSERTLTDYLKVMMKELNPEDEDGVVDSLYGIEDYKIIVKGLEDKLHARDIGLKREGSKKLQLRKLRYNQLFSFEELNQIIEAVLFLKNIDTSTKEKLIKKLQKVTSMNYPKYSPFISEITGKISTNISNVYEDSRVDEVMVRKNLKIIRQAIEANNDIGNKIAFHFNGYNEKKELIPRRKPSGEIMTYVANPYYVILYNGKYYLVCSVDPYDDVGFYRIDLMSDITDKTKVSVLDGETMVSERRKPKRMVKGLPVEWNDTIASEFQAEHMYMFFGQPCTIRLKLDKDRYTLLHDYFGDRYTFVKHIDDRWDEVEVTCVLKAMESWAMQCSEYVEVLKPVELRNSIFEKCRRLLERYR